jgi:hypothetical protein
MPVHNTSLYNKERERANNLCDFESGEPFL